MSKKHSTSRSGKTPLIIICLLSLFFSSVTISSEQAVSREQAVEIAKQGHDSKVLKIVKQKNTTGSVYRVKLLTKEGRVKQVIIDASNGQVQGK